MLTHGQKQFLSLIRAGLWGTIPNAATFRADVRWEWLYQMGWIQGLLGIMLDGIRLLPKDLYPPKELYIKWCVAVLGIEDENHKLNAEIANLYSLLRPVGVEPVILKGQGVAANYPEPLHRQSGDIDLYTGGKYFEKANEVISRDVTETIVPTETHAGYMWHGIEVENHKKLIEVAPVIDGRIIRDTNAWYDAGEFRHIAIEGVEVSLPPLDFDVVYSLQHIVKHLFGLGVGLRQLCDWACMLHANRYEIDKKEITRLLRRWQLTRAAKIFGAVVVEYLGMPRDEVPVPYGEKDEKYAARIFNDIWLRGNFGSTEDRETGRPKGYWSGKLFSYISRLKHNCGLWYVAPFDAMWVPWLKYKAMLRYRKHASDK